MSLKKEFLKRSDKPIVDQRRALVRDLYPLRDFLNSEFRREISECGED